MPTFLTSMLVALLVSARNPQKPSTRQVPPSTTLAPAVLGLKYGHDFDEGYRVTFDHDEASRVVVAEIGCDASYKHYYTFRATLRLDGGNGGKGCFRYYYVTDEGVKLLKLAKEEVKKRCDATLPEGAFTDMYFFDEFMITNLDDGAHIV
ncbi:hypothetical protein FOZ62_003931, partial [Perkinsus olseni]